MSSARFCFLVPLFFIAVLIATCDAASQDKRPVPFGKRNLGGKLKDWYLSKMTHNYFCTDHGRLVPVDPETGHMLLRGLRKRSNWFDDFLGHSPKTEQGLCHNPTWVLPPGWTQPIPVTQFSAQYPWMEVDDRGQIHLKADYRAWLEQQAAARAAGGQNSAAPGTQTPGVVPDGGVGYVPSSYLNVGQGMGTTSGLGQNTFGNGIAAGTAAHV